MTGHRLEVADVFRAHQNQFLLRWGHVVSDQQRKVLRDIGRCRTAALGTHLERCDRCNYETVAYDSCRNRHCPKCQSSARDRWLMKQASSLLPVPYAHVVFTVPEQLAPLALRNQRLFYNLLFRSASETLLEIAADPRHHQFPADRQDDRSDEQADDAVRQRPADHANEDDHDRRRQAAPHEEGLERIEIGRAHV